MYDCWWIRSTGLGCSIAEMAEKGVNGMGRSRLFMGACSTWEYTGGGWARNQLGVCCNCEKRPLVHAMPWHVVVGPTGKN